MKKLAFALVLTAGCTGGLPLPSPADAARTHLPLEQLTRGRQTYVDKCSGCHAPMAPETHTASKWDKAVAEMGEKAHLAPADKELILTYLSSFARPSRDSAPPKPPTR